MSFLQFPPDFLWGTATAAHQAEGHNFNNDWWDWEQTPGHIKNNDTARVASDWWNGRYLEDFDRAQDLGTRTHRLSIEWSRIEPRQGEVDPEAIDFYRRVLQALHVRGITPMVTVIHFTLPRWVAAQGGWENPQMPRWLAAYTDTLVRHFGDLCNLWVTLNEPNGSAAFGYALGTAPPGKKNVPTALRVITQMVRGHAAIFHALKRVQPNARAGIAYNIRPFFPYRRTARRDRFVVRLLDRVFNRSILDAIDRGRLQFPVGRQSVPEARGTQDFIGLNHYYVETVKFDLAHFGELFRHPVYRPETRRLTEKFSNAGDVDPKGFEYSMNRLARYGKPIYITENGIFDLDDDFQSRYLVGHIAAVHRSLQAGADIRGYYWWTLVDNFEWLEGYVPRFGLYDLDVASQVRTRRPVADVYARIIRENGIADDLMDKYAQDQSIRD